MKSNNEGKGTKNDLESPIEVLCFDSLLVKILNFLFYN